MAHRILLVDDEKLVTEALTRALRREPYEVLTALSGQAALELMARAPVDLVVADEKMPGMSGTELLTSVRRLYPETIRMILTGQATLDAAICAINDAGIHRFFTKPYSDADLAQSIRQALALKDTMEATTRMLHQIRSQAARLAANIQQAAGLKDAMVEMTRLLETSRQFSTQVETLERKVEGTAKIIRDKNGALIVGRLYDPDVPLDELARDIEEEIGRHANGTGPAVPR